MENVSGPVYSKVSASVSENSSLFFSIFLFVSFLKKIFFLITQAMEEYILNVM